MQPVIRYQNINVCMDSGVGDITIDIYILIFMELRTDVKLHLLLQNYNVPTYLGLLN
jgi:hypothetical protein